MRMEVKKTSEKKQRKNAARVAKVMERVKRDALEGKRTQFIRAFEQRSTAWKLSKDTDKQEEYKSYKGAINKNAVG